jgi:hypothetical protein
MPPRIYPLRPKNIKPRKKEAENGFAVHRLLVEHICPHMETVYIRAA